MFKIFFSLNSLQNPPRDNKASDVNQAKKGVILKKFCNKFMIKKVGIGNKIY